MLIVQFWIEIMTKNSLRLTQYAEHLPWPQTVYVYVERWGATAADTQFMISYKVCVDVFVCVC